MQVIQSPPPERTQVAKLFYQRRWILIIELAPGSVEALPGQGCLTGGGRVMRQMHSCNNEAALNAALTVFVNTKFTHTLTRLKCNSRRGYSSNTALNCPLVAGIRVFDAKSTFHGALEPGKTPYKGSQRRCSTASCRTTYHPERLDVKVGSREAIQQD